MSRFATVLALAMCIGTSSASGGCRKHAKGIFNCEGKEMAYFEEEFVGPFETSGFYELENKGHGFYTKVNPDFAPSGLAGCAFDEDDTHEANCANVHNTIEFAHHWAEDCDSFSYEGLRPKNFMEEYQFVERGQCHRVGSGRPHRDSKEDGHHEDC